MIYYRTNPVPVFSIPPNWKSSVKMIENHGGLIREALSTFEERLADRHRGLWGIRYKTLSLTAQEMAYIRKVLETPAAIPFACGFWPNACKMTVIGTAGTPYITVDDAAASIFDVLPYAMIWTAFDTFETKRVIAKSATEIMFTDGLAATWPAGSWVVPVTLGQLKRPDARSLTDENDSFGVTFDEKFLPDSVYSEEVISGIQTYQLQPLEQVGTGGPLL